MTAATLVEPAYLTCPPYVRTDGPEVAELCEAVGFPPDAAQRRGLDLIFAVGADDRAAAFEIAVICARQNLKALAWDTPILTAAGWRTMATVQVADEVYHPAGHTVAVTAVSDIVLGRACYRVRTTDGRSVVADGDHLWGVYDTRMGHRRVPRPLCIATTTDLLEAGLARGLGRRPVVADGTSYLTAEYRWQLPRQHALKTPDVDLPVDPYLLGAWLGDGRSAGASLSAHADDVPHWLAEVARCGFVPTVSVGRTCVTVGITCPQGVGRQTRSFGAKLRALGVLGNKHVPDAYLAAGTAQRESLLQGLMDTDGTAHRKTGQCTFTSTRRGLGEAVEFLARSLGWRARMTEGRARLAGRDCGPKYTVTFTPKTGDGAFPFRLPRKAMRVGATDGNRGRFTVSVQAIEPVASVPVRCIKVASPDGLFLAGRDLLPTHNTGLFKQAVIGWLWLLDQRLVIWSAHEFSTAQEAFRDLEELVTGSDLLRRRVKAVHRGNGEEAIELVGDRRLKFKARTKGGGRGLTGDKVVLDEGMYLLPAHMGALLPTLSARPDPQVLYGASAGLSESAVLRGVRDRGRMVADGPGRLAYMEFCDDLPGNCQLGESCDHRLGSPGCRLDDEARWARANPTLGHRITVEYLRAERQSLPPAEFARERLGWWDDPDEDVDELLAKWAEGIDLESAPTGRPVYCVDASPGSRSASVVAVLRRSDGLPQAEVVDHRPGVDWVLERCTELLAHKPVGWVIDPSSPVGALAWDKAGYTMRQANSKTPSGPKDVTELVGRDMGQACEGFATAVREGRLRHLGDARLLAALQGAGRRDIGDGLWAWSRRKSGVDISPLVGATGALWGLTAMPQPAVPMVDWR